MEYTQTELRFMALCSLFGAAFSYLIGGVDGPVIALLFFIIADYLTGLWKAWKGKIVDSNVGWEGIRRKGVMLLVVMIGHQLDLATGLETFRNMVIFAYIGNEGFSICENLDKLGYCKYIPNTLRLKLVQLREEKQNSGGK